VIVLGLGTNLGDRAANIRAAIKKLSTGPKPILQNIRSSHVYESDAMLPEGADKSWEQKFLNIAVAGDTSLDEASLLEEIKYIEELLGRKKRDHWAPREIDIDILVWDDRVFEKDDLQIPHKGLAERPFALLPLMDLAPDWVHPLEKKTPRALSKKWNELPYGTKLTRDYDLKIFAPELIGILNITPDSFSDGGRYTSFDSALKQAKHLLDAGATVLDIGAESTRPDGKTLCLDEEWSRLSPILSGFKDQLLSDGYKNFKIALDSRNPETMEKAMPYGIDWINDVSGFANPKMAELAAQTKSEVVLMHALSLPVVKGETIPVDCDPIEFLSEWALNKMAELESYGISKDKIIFDPGIGFGKNPEQSLKILEDAGRFHELGVRLYIGHSRKSFLNLFTDNPFSQRDIETVAASLAMIHQREDYLRVHNVEAHARGFKTYLSLS
jgi:2-amino-4-hydroxy-6-hydroxymethyldihydropteridine diphosphokinase/dihydropteroate synthase